MSWRVTFITAEYRITSPTWCVMPAARAAALIAAASSPLKANGFSQKSALPAAATFSANGRWLKVGVEM